LTTALHYNNQLDPSTLYLSNFL